MTAAATTTLNKVGSAVAIIMTLMLGAAIGMLSQLDIPQANHDLLLVLATALATNVTQIVSYFFGSSSNNKSKDDTIAAQAATIATTVPPVTTVPLHTGETAKAVP
jgi:predicted CDP-diglyceride synthetase/phosphatidate cytidylyltransferase